MNCGCVFIENDFGNLKNQWQILKNLNCKVDKRGKIIMACCIFHNLCQMMDMPKSVVCDVHKKGDALVGFCGQHVLVIRKVMQ